MAVSSCTAYFKVELVAGRTYRAAFETNFTQPEFHGGWYGYDMWIWSPADWGGWPSTYFKGFDEEDVEPHWCPYPYKLNKLNGSWDGGNRIEFVATETGTWYFLFSAFDYGPGGTPDFGFVIYEVVDTSDTSERDITAEPQEGLGPLGVQFRDVEAEE